MANEHKPLSRADLLRILWERGIKVDIRDYGCGCCGRPQVRFLVDGVKLFEDDLCSADDWIITFPGIEDD